MSSKRRAEDNVESDAKAAKTEEQVGPSQRHANNDEEELVFEDPFEDEFEEESFEDAYESDAEMGDAEENEGGKDEKEMIQDDEGNESAQRKVWLPSQTPLQPGETLEYDSDAYDVIHFLTTEWPCLSFDVLPDKLGMMRKKYPHTLFLAAGTQADRAQANKIVLLRLSQLSKTRESGSDSDDGALNLDADDSGEEEDPIIEHRDIPHAHGCVNRLRVMPQAPHIVATMADNAQATIFDAKHALLALEGGISRAPSKAGQALFHFKHDAEGYALAWNVKTEGRLLTGDCNGVIRHWSPLEGGRWAIDGESFSGHADSVEDVQWSPSEADVFASCSVDKTVRLWDTRKGHAPVATLRAHNTDVNVMSWNAKRAFLLLSGADDGVFKVWDLRKLAQQDTSPQFQFDWHKQAITSVEWSPHDDSVLSVTSEDDSCSTWDLSLANEKTQVDGVDIPSQLLFLHQGQEGMKEVHWHKQIPGLMVTTAGDGFCVFKPNNIE